MSERTRVHNFDRPFVLIFFILVGIVLRIVLRNGSLWEDEIISVTHATQPLWRVVVATLINDLHPPLYFVQLHFWSLISQRDGWFVANSVLLSLLALASMYWVARQLGNARKALACTAVFACWPACLWLAGEVRMYAMLSLLFIWLYYFIVKVFANGERRPTYAFAIAGLSIVIVYTHAIGFVAVLFYGIYAASWLVERKAARREWFTWLAIFGAAALTAVPMLIANIFRPADMVAVHALRDLLDQFAGIVMGLGYTELPWLRPVGIAIFLMATAAGLFMAQTRRLTLLLVIVPVMVCVLVDLVARPLFKTAFFANFYSVIFALILGELIYRQFNNRWVKELGCALAFGMLCVVGIVHRRVMNEYNDYYHQAAVVIQEHAQPGDLVWVPQADIFWGVAWYLSGPYWGSPLEINEAWRPGSGWWKVYNFLGPSIAKAIELPPQRQKILAKDGLPIIVGKTSGAQTEQAKRIWIVAYAPRGDILPELYGAKLGARPLENEWRFHPVVVNLYSNKLR